MALVPFAEHKLIPPGANDPRIRARIGILHVDAGNTADLYDFFRSRSGGIESHGHIRKDGHLYQYRDTDYEADANYRANPFATSWETQGYGEGEWTPEQIATIKRVMLWQRDAHGTPLRVATSWDDPAGGWGYHTLFGSPSPWTPVAKSCPGPDRIRQFHNVLVPWMAEQNNEEDTLMAEISESRLREIIREELRAVTSWAKSARAQALAAHREGIEANDKLDDLLDDEEQA